MAQIVLWFSIIVMIVVMEVLLESVREIDLSSNWSVRNQNGSINQQNLKIPFGVYSILYKEDVLLSYKDVNLRWIAYDNWTFFRNFSVKRADFENVRFVNLTLHGVDTVSTIRLNGQIIGHTNNMFVRYSFDVQKHLELTNLLEIEIRSPVYAAKEESERLLAKKNFTIPPNCPPSVYNGECHMNMLRKMQASFGWDWGLAAPSMGIWKDVVLEYYDAAVLRDVDVALARNTTHWTMNIRAFLDTGIKQNFYGELIFYAVELFQTPRNVSYRYTPIGYTYPIIEFEQAIPVKDVTLWWPNGYGDQKLYPLHFTMNAWFDQDGPRPRAKTVSHKSIRVGFRTIELNQDAVDNSENGDHFYFQVNDVPIFMKGTNYIPSHILPEFSNDQDRIKHLLRSAKEANMNMIRVWGGGIYESDFFYDTADYYGILIWQDMMFACAMYPTTDEFLESVRLEVIQNAKRIAHHPSVAIFVTNNENEVALQQNWYGTNSQYSRFADEYRQLYVATVAHELRIVSHSSRPVPLISSPSNGAKGLEDNYISENPQDPNYGDIHFYEILKDPWDVNIYPRPRFASEYGFQSLPSMQAWKLVLGKREKIDDLMKHRQHHPAGMVPITTLVRHHLPLPLPQHPLYMEALIYFSQVAQAMATKIETELYRSQRSTQYHTMGALYWQLNDLWVAPSWSSIDFYGNFKLLHYWAKDFLAPTTIIVLFDKMTQSLNVSLVRDDHRGSAVIMDVAMNTYLWSHLYPKKQITWKAELKPNSDHLNKVIPIEQFLVDPFTKENCFLEFVLSQGSIVVARTYHFPTHIKLATGVQDPKISVEISSSYCGTPMNSYSLAIKVQYPAIFVFIEIVHKDIIKYQLSRNGFMQVNPIQIVHLEFEYTKCVNITAENVKLNTVNRYMVNQIKE